MARFIGMLVLLSGLAMGCKSITGPIASKTPEKVDDDPLFSLQEQEERGRARYPIPEDDSRLIPNAYINRYGTTYPSIR